MEKIKCSFEYRKLEKGENLYDDVDLSQCSIIDAQYREIAGEENNPDLCALPRMPSAREIIDLGMVSLPGYDHEQIKQMTTGERLEAIEDLDRVMIPLGIHMEVARTIWKMLHRRYKHSDVMVSTNDDEITYGKGSFGCNIVSVPKDEAPNPIGFMLHGKTGCGKTMSVQLLCRMFPKVIYHEFENYSYVQIPIIMVTALRKNLRDIFDSIATTLDRYLNTGDFHERKVRSTNIAAAESHVKRWISMYHIGLIIVDEVQFLDFSPKKRNIEDIVSITQATGAQFGLIGNEDGLREVIKYDRLHRRVAKHMIDADLMTQNNIRLFENAIDVLWQYQFTDCVSELTDNIKSALMFHSSRNIALLKYIMAKVQTSAVISRRKEPIDEFYISQQVADDMEKIRSMLADPSDPEDAEYSQYLTKLYAKLSSDVSSETETDKGRLLEMISAGKLTKARESVRNGAFRSIKNTTDYTETMINRAIRKAIDEEPDILDHPEDILTKKALRLLNEANSQVKRKETRALNKAAKGKPNAAKIDKEIRQSLALIKASKKKKDDNDNESKAVNE